jgi:hypothetical protein
VKQQNTCFTGGEQVHFVWKTQQRQQQQQEQQQQQTKMCHNSSTRYSESTVYGFY